MNLLDLLIIAPVGYFAWKGLYTGFVNELFSLAGLCIAVIFTVRCLHDVVPALSPCRQVCDTARITSCIRTFVMILILVQIVIFWMDKIIVFSNSGLVNHRAGLAFAALRKVIPISA